MAFFQDPPKLGNQYTDDRVLRQTLTRLVPKDALRDIEPHLQRMGERAGGELLELAQKHAGREHEPRHIPMDPWGRRIDVVEVSPAWQHYRRVAAEEGVVGAGYERKHGAHSRLHQFSLAYLMHPSSQTYTCPLAMTDGAARTLETMGPAELRQRILPRLVSRDPKQAYIAGQWMTERTGGSDVGLSETVARRDGDTWRLYGNKWFTSAITADIALTLGRPEGNGPGGKGLALFFVELRDAAGRLQNIRVDRLKDKLGTRHLPTAEIELEGTPAIPLAGLTDGVKNISTVLNLTRTWNAVCSIAPMARGLALARDFARRRVAFGAPLAEKPLHLDTLAGIAAEHEAMSQLVFHAVHLLGKSEVGEISPSEAAILAALQPLMKLTTAKTAVACVSEVVECFAGAGYCEDTGLPELLRDTQVVPIWEGTTNVLSLETYRTLRREEALGPLLESARARVGKARDARLKAPGEAALKALEHAAVWLKETMAQPEPFEAGARAVALTLGRATALSLLVEHAQFCLDQLHDRRPLLAAERFASNGVDALLAPRARPEDSRSLGMDLGQ